MSTYWTEADLRDALSHGDARIIGPVGAMVHEAAPICDAISEKAFMSAVIRLAAANGFKVFHPFDSRKSAPGYPDLTMAKPGQPVIFAELKTADGVLTIEQDAWLHVLREAQNTEVYCWRPSDMPFIRERLSHA